MSYYAERNGWVDNGKKISTHPCPNCGSSNFIETVSLEYCPDCGLECNYWGGGSNHVYQDMMERNWAKQEDEKEDRIRRQMIAEWGFDPDE